MKTPDPCAANDSENPCSRFSPRRGSRARRPPWRSSRRACRPSRKRRTAAEPLDIALRPRSRASPSPRSRRADPSRLPRRLSQPRPPAPAPGQTTPAEPDGSETLRALRKDARVWAGRTEALLPRLREPFEPVLQAIDRAIADPIGTAKTFAAWAQTEPAQVKVLPGMAAGLLVLLMISLLRGWGDAVIAIEYPGELRGAFSVHLSRSKEAARRLPRTSSPSALMRAKRKASASSRRHHYMVSRETQFRGIRAGRWWITVDGYLQSPSGEEVIATHFEERELRVRRGSTDRLDFDFRPKDCPVDVKVVSPYWMDTSGSRPGRHPPRPG